MTRDDARQLPGGSARRGWDVPAAAAASAAAAAARQHPVPLAERRAALWAGSVALVLAITAFAQTQTGGSGPRGRGAQVELAQAASQLLSFESKLNHDKGRLNTVIHRLGEIKTAEAQIRKEQAALLAKERATRATVHRARNKVVALKYKIHNIKQDAFSNALFDGPKAAEAKKAQAHDNLRRKARELKTQRAQFETIVGKVQRELRDASTRPAAQEATALHTAQATNKIVAGGLTQTQKQISAMRQQAAAKARAAAALQKKKDADMQKALELEREQKVARERPIVQQIVRRAEGKHAHAGQVAQMQAQVLRKRMTSFTRPKHASGSWMLGRVALTRAAKQTGRLSDAYSGKASAVQAKNPVTLEEASALASKRAVLAQRQAYMRSPQYWQSQQAATTMKRFGMMPGLPLLKPLDRAAADI